MKINDRVKVRADRVDTFLQPWRDRFRAGRVGTIIRGPSANIQGWLVEWDHRRSKYDHDWRQVMVEGDLENAS